MSRAMFATGRDGTRIYVRGRAGPAPHEPGRPVVTAVLTDGIACDGFIWKYLWDDLARVVDVAHWNYRGHGRSGKPEDPTAIELVDHAHDLDAVRRAIGDGPVVIVAHSMGCQVALETYRLRPDGILGLVLICGSPGRITHSFKGTNVLAQILPRVIERVDAHPEVVRAIWSRVPPEVTLRFALMAGEVDKNSIAPEDLMPYMTHMVDIDPPMFLRMLRSAGNHDATDLLPHVGVPALVIAGDRDSFTPSRFAEKMATTMPKGELLMVVGGTHVVPLERKELVSERIEQFLRERVGV
jgi:pimeloyl-ACP methyl ester carboxylesterase